MGEVTPDDEDEAEDAAAGRGRFTLEVWLRAGSQPTRRWSAARWWVVLGIIAILALQAIWIAALYIVAGR